LLNVFFTVDVEIWCDGWNNIDNNFPRAFQRHIYGPTPEGNFGLPYQINLLRHYGFTGVFFIEPFFSLRCGHQPLAEVVQLVQSGLQEVQLHLHTEWLDESEPPLVKGLQDKQQHLKNFSLSEQTHLIEAGIDLLSLAGAHGINAFRAGNFAANNDTLVALANNNIRFDSSYNESLLGTNCGITSASSVLDTQCIGETYEYPMTVFDDGSGSLRHAQLTACTFSEIQHLLWQALEMNYHSFTILSHSFELLNQTKSQADKIVVKRFESLLEFLDQNREVFCVRGFQGLPPNAPAKQPPLLASSLWRTGRRVLEQVYRRRFH